VATPVGTPTQTEAAASPDSTAAPTSTPKPRRTPTATPAPQTYVVLEGDTLSTIADRFGISVAALQRANGLGGSDVINVGQVLIIP
jgi:LysM repeat protein